jgi:hypothetical protein
MKEVLNIIAQYTRTHLDSVSIGLVATFLMVYGYKINGIFRKQTRSMHFFIRYVLFVVLCSAGYGFASSQATKMLKTWLKGLPNVQLVGAVFVGFLILGFLAKRGKEV